MEHKILAHMNKDHKIALEDYLAVYGNVKIDSSISNIKLKSIEPSQLMISFKRKGIDFEIEKLISIDPPMKNVVSESRERLVEMAKVAAEKRGYSHVQVKQMVYPNKPFHYVLIALVTSVVWGYFSPETFYNSFCTNLLKIPTSNSVLSFMRKYNSEIFYGLFATHLSETAFVMLPKLRKYRVPTDIKIEWIAACIYEGFPSIKRFNSLVEK